MTLDLMIYRNVTLSGFSSWGLPWTRRPRRKTLQVQKSKTLVESMRPLLHSQ